MIKSFLQQIQQREIKIDRRQRRIFARFIWLILYTILFVPWLGYDYRVVFIIPALEIASMIFAFIINEKVLTFLLVRKRIVIYTILIIIIVFGVSFVMGQLEFLIASKFNVEEPLKPFQMMIKNSVLMIYSVFVSTVTTFALQNYDDREINNNLMIEKREMELKFLKMQINPHFLFNSLNNIYSMSVTEDKNTPECIMKLSNMLRYVVDNNSGFVNINREVSHLKDFIEFNRLCSDGNQRVVFDYKVSDNGIHIPAMLLQPLLENCYKHGRSDDVIKVSLTAEKGVITFITENRVSREEAEESTGIGLQNVRKRVELHYPGKYSMEAIRNGDVFITRLIIQAENEEEDGKRKEI